MNKTAHETLCYVSIYCITDLILTVLMLFSISMTFDYSIVLLNASRYIHVVCSCLYKNKIQGYAALCLKLTYFISFFFVFFLTFYRDIICIENDKITNVR